MMKINLNYTLVLMILLVGVQFFAPNSIFAQRRDHLTDAEIELIRDEQSVDRRMEIYVKAIDRRFTVLNGDAANSANVKPPEKVSEKWGELPKGSRAEMLVDIEGILDESISKVDDVADHDVKSKLFAAAVNILANGANRFIPELKKQLDRTDDEKEKGAILGALDFCDQIIEASAKVPKLSDKEIKKIQKDAEKEAEKARQSN